MTDKRKEINSQRQALIGLYRSARAVAIISVVYYAAFIHRSRLSRYRAGRTCGAPVGVLCADKAFGLCSAPLPPPGGGGLRGSGRWPSPVLALRVANPPPPSYNLLAYLFPCYFDIDLFRILFTHLNELSFALRRCLSASGAPSAHPII